mmetsp:Transcript_173280/g.555758  ORF Transcript_173280/g.555758 Transcript_173280/m.555758 type:complete len:804 (+) Transcript_173280:54-2465(+)
MDFNMAIDASDTSQFDGHATEQPVSADVSEAPADALVMLVPVECFAASDEHVPQILEEEPLRRSESPSRSDKHRLEMAWEEHVFGNECVESDVQGDGEECVQSDGQVDGHTVQLPAKVAIPAAELPALPSSDERGLNLREHNPALHMQTTQSGRLIRLSEAPAFDEQGPRMMVDELEQVKETVEARGDADGALPKLPAEVIIPLAELPAPSSSDEPRPTQREERILDRLGDEPVLGKEALEIEVDADVPHQQLFRGAPILFAEHPASLSQDEHAPFLQEAAAEVSFVSDECARLEVQTPQPMHVDGWPQLPAAVPMFGADHRLPTSDVLGTTKRDDTPEFEVPTPKIRRVGDVPTLPSQETVPLSEHHLLPTSQAHGPDVQEKALVPLALHSQELDCSWPQLPADGYHGLCHGGFNRWRLKSLAEPVHDAELWQQAFRDAGDGTANPNMAAIRQLRTLTWLQTEKVINLAKERHDMPKELPQHLALADTAHTELVTLDVSVVRRVEFAMPQVSVENRDILQVSQELCGSGCRVGVLNMASAWHPGGGFRSGAGAQEENLHRRSDAVRFTDEQRSQFYPIPQDACLLSRSVTVLRGTEADGYPFLDQPFQVSMISCAAPHGPRLTGDLRYRDVLDEAAMRTKIELIVEAGVRAECDALALSAFGCGAFGNPPEVVAEMFREVLSTHSDKIRHVVFCILNDHNSGRWHNPFGNFAPFAEAFAHRAAGGEPSQPAYDEPPRRQLAVGVPAPGRPLPDVRRRRVRRRALCVSVLLVCSLALLVRQLGLPSHDCLFVVLGSLIPGCCP